MAGKKITTTMRSILLTLLCVVSPGASSRLEKPRLLRQLESTTAHVDDNQRVVRLAHITSQLCSANVCYVLHLTNSSTLSRDDARRFCEQLPGGPGHLASIVSKREADMVSELLVSSASQPLVANGELWLGLRRGRAGCEAPTGPLRGFTWKAADRASAAAAAATVPGTADAPWSEHQQAPLDCAQEQCGTMAVIDAAAGVSEWRQRYCSRPTGASGALCRLTCEPGPCPRGPRPNPPPLLRPERQAPCRPGTALVSGACEDVDECDDFSLCFNAICDNTDGSFTCDCLTGYKRVDATTCEDIDECAEGQHECDPFPCRNRDGFHECACPAGYVEDRSGLSCHDLDECAAEGQGGCRHACANTPGGYACSCRAGFELAPDGRGCSPLGATAAPPGPGGDAAARNLLPWIVVPALLIVACVAAAAALCRRRSRKRRPEARAGQGVGALGGEGTGGQQRRGVDGANGDDAWLDSRP